MQSVILQTLEKMKKERDIWRRIETRIRKEKKWKYDMLVQDTVQTSISFLQEIKKGISDDQSGEIFTRMVLKGKIWQAV